MTADGTPTALQQVLYLQEDAAFWANRLPRFAAAMQARADRFALVAGFLSAITGLGIWATIAASIDPRAQVAVGFVALAAAVVGLVPKTMGYADCASNAFDISAAYGHAEGELVKAHRKLVDEDPDALAFAEDARKAFEEVRIRKEKLHPYLTALEAERQRVLPDPFGPKLSASVPVIA